MDPASPDGSVTVWLGRLKAGDPAAAGPLWEGYFERLVALARARLRSVPRAAADEEDVALSAFDSFCRAARQGRFPRLDDRDDLWQVLLLITTRKAGGLAKHERRQKRGGGQVVQASATAGQADSTPDALAAAPGPEPAPEFVAQVSEECARLLGCLGDTERQVAVAKMEGHTNEEIARQIGRSVPTVERKLALVRRRWQWEGAR